MQRLIPCFKTRQGTPRLAPQVAWQVSKCSWEAPGGCKRARLRARAARAAVGELLDMLGAHLEIYDSTGTPTWWGYVDALSVRQGAAGARAALQEIANRVRVVYSEPRPGDMPAPSLSTAWADDLVSQGVYGIKEAQLRLTATSLAQAEAYRDAHLLARSRPVLLPVTGPQGGVEIELEMEARGWFDTLGWRTYHNQAGRAAYTSAGAGVQAVGDISAHTRAGQSFTPAAGSWPVEVVWAMLRKAGCPCDNLCLQLCADSGGSPGSVLASAAPLPATSLPEDYTWTAFTFSTPAEVSQGVPCWLVWSRSGALSPTDHYVFKVNEALGFSGGVLRLDNGSGWAVRSPDADLLFWAQGATQTSVQIADIAAPGAGGQFFSGVRTDCASGLYTCPYREGSTTALHEMLTHLRAGTSSGTELLACVTPERVLVVYPKPPASSATWRLTRQGLLTTPAGAEVPAHQAARLTGEWAALDADWHSLGADSAALGQRAWLQRLTWRAEDGHVRAG